MYKEEVMDLAINNVYTLELNYGDKIYEADTKENIIISPNQLNKLHYI